LLVSLEDIDAALQRYYPDARAHKKCSGESARIHTVSLADYDGLALTLPKVETAMTMDGVLNLVAKLKTLPALPDTVQRIHTAIENPETLTQDVVKIVERDPALAAKMIGLANSAAYAVRHKVDNVLMAVTMLGLREVYALVLSSAVIEHFENSKEFDYKAHWRRSMYCATAARAVHRRCGGRGGSTIFAAGLLHDLGQLVFAELMSKRYAEISLDAVDQEIIRLESEVFGIAHPEVGYALACEWNLPEEILAPIRFHHNPSLAKEHNDIVAMVALAAALADSFAGRIGEERLSNAGETALTMLGLQPSVADEIRDEIGSAFTSAT
jgi:HD-like signal output (HDOD) protein